MRKLPLVRIPAQTTVHRFGAPTGAPRSSALLRFGDEGWTIHREADAPQGWAIVGDGEGRRLAVETLLSRHRLQPVVPPPGPFPYITWLQQPFPSSPMTPPPSSSTSPSSSPPSSEPNLDVVDRPKPIRHLAFARPPATGEFTDFTARYGALLDEDALTFRQTLSSLHPPPPSSEVERVAHLMRIQHLLDLPAVSQSSGQTRRARIAAALLSRPALLLLEDPMAGLDIPSRQEVEGILGELNASGDIRIVLVLRGKGVLPVWITDVCEVRDGEAWIGRKSDYEARARRREAETATPAARIEGVADTAPVTAGRGEGRHAASEPVIQLNGVSVSYGEGTRQNQVLKDIAWTIRPGDKWHLQGANGSGKTTLLSLILGHHPRSFSLPATSLTLFSKPRRATPTPILRTLIGHTSPEIYASFPRGMSLTAGEAVGSGFEGVFSRRAFTPPQRERILRLIERFAPDLQSSRPGLGAVASDGGDVAQASAAQIASRQFSHFTPPQQALLLFLRAIVARPKLVVLDEPSQGMDEVVWARCRALLEEEWADMPEQAVIVVSHYEDEVPWEKSDGKVLKLDMGQATVHA